MKSDKKYKEEENDFAKVKEKSDDDYEKNITYISAGTLVLSLTFVEKIVNLGQSSVVWCLITSWSFMGLTLLINLVSHQISSHYAQCCDEELRLQVAKEKTFRMRIRWIRNLNWTTTATLSLGMFFLIVFCSINAVNMSDHKKTDQKPQTATVPTQNREQKGRPITIPTSVLKPPINTEKPQNNTGGSHGNSNSTPSKPEQ